MTIEKAYLEGKPFTVDVALSGEERNSLGSTIQRRVQGRSQMVELEARAEAFLEQAHAITHPEDWMHRDDVKRLFSGAIFDDYFSDLDESRLAGEQVIEILDGISFEGKVQVDPGIIDPAAFKLGELSLHGIDVVSGNVVATSTIDDHRYEEYVGLFGVCLDPRLPTQEAPARIAAWSSDSAAEMKLVSDLLLAR